MKNNNNNDNDIDTFFLLKKLLKIKTKKAISIFTISQIKQRKKKQLLHIVKTEITPFALI